MTKSEQQLQELCDMGVMVVSCPDATTRKAVAFCDDFLVLGQLEGETDAHAVLTHEKWHYKLGAFYRHDAPYEQRCRAEAQVNRAALQELVPKCRLAALLRQRWMCPRPKFGRRGAFIATLTTVFAPAKIKENASKPPVDQKVGRGLAGIYGERGFGFSAPCIAVHGIGIIRQNILRGSVQRAFRTPSTGGRILPPDTAACAGR